MPALKTTSSEPGSGGAADLTPRQVLSFMVGVYVAVNAIRDAGQTLFGE